MQHESTVLIVDDNPRGRKTLQTLLLDQGYNLVFANDGPEALVKAAELRPDVILLDVMMPNMDGFEVCQRLRADPSLAEVPVIMVTALDDRDSRLQGLEAGADDFVSKPFDRAELRTRVQTVTRLNRYRRLSLERAKFEWVVNQAEDGYLITNAYDQVLYANPQAALYLGLPVGETPPISETFLTLAKKQYHCEPEVTWARWPGQPVIPTPLYLVRPASETNSVFWLQVDRMEMQTQTHESERYLLRLRDVTATVVERRFVWTFHSQVSHKLRTPLTQVVSSLEIMAQDDGPLSEEMVNKIFQIAYRGAIRLRDEIQDIFHYLEAPDMLKLGQGRCSLAQVSAIAAEIETGLGLKPITISYEGLDAPDNTYIRFSRQILKLILSELLENAKRFHPLQSPNLEITVAGVAGNVQIQICDDGLALSPDHLAKIWIPYYQAEKYFTGQVKGPGLGLSTVASLVWGIGGACQAYNRPEGPGIVIELVLPFV